MGTYLGLIEIRGPYYNYIPLYEYSNDKFHQLTESDYIRVLPDSERKNINFWYDFRLDEEFMDNHFYEDIPIVFEFEKEDLELNFDRDHNLNSTGYKVYTRDEYEKGRIYDAADLGCYLLLDETDLAEDPRTSSILAIGTERITDDLKVLIHLRDEDLLIGPFEVNYRKYDQTYTIINKPEDNKYMLSGYDRRDCEILPLSHDNPHLVYAKPTKDAQIRYIDIISEKTLLDAFRSCIKDDLLADGKLDLSNIDAATESFEKSLLFVDDNAIRSKRLRRIEDLLSISDDVDYSIKNISKKLGSELIELLLKYDDKESADGFVNQLLESTPDILNKLPDFRYTKDQIDLLRAQEEKVRDELDSYQAELENAKQLSDVDQEIINNLETLKLEIDEANEKKEQLEKETFELQNKLSSITSFEELQQEVHNLEKKSEYLEMRKTQLSRETTELSTRLSELTSNIEKKISEMPIDGLVANMMVEASSSWKANLEHDHYVDIINKYNELPVIEKNPKEMVEYMYNQIKSVRPLYDKNTITNICACIFQNFLTVFSGDPGCGKTSICNIIGQSLGLEKIGELISNDATRYIPVSVERGWTSKRDFIGYYNPLTKTFDKNNKRVFEALQIADIEEENGCTRFPMMILLDEANLSPMEYYWADFMNICDDITASNEINIGESTILNVPETLHFVATINNDHTTETLSPRLIDRAAVITLPKVSLNEIAMSTNTGALDSETVEIISWGTIKNTYITCPNNRITLPVTAKRIYEDILKNHLRKQQIYVSPRTEISIIKYCAITSELFEASSDSARRDPAIIALDYAIAQKILPKINGYGDEYAQWLKDLQKKCDDNYLIRTKEILSDIITKGEANMSYYQFFA